MATLPGTGLNHPGAKSVHGAHRRESGGWAQPEGPIGFRCSVDQAQIRGKGPDESCFRNMECHLFIQ